MNLRTIICKKCGAPIDASLGECPLCGAVYYILPQNEDDEEQTRVWDNTAAAIHSAIEKEERDENAPEDDATKVIPPVPVIKDEPKPKPKAAPAKPANRAKQPQNKTWIYAGMAAALLAMLVVVMCFMMGVFDFGANQMEMPDLMGLQRDVAVSQLKALDISPNLIYEESTEPSGTVIHQKPAAGESITKRTGITLTVSSGSAETPKPDEEFVQVPDLLDMDYDEAIRTLKALGLNGVKSAEEFSPIVEEGRVMRQSPLSEAKVAPGENVLLTVSKGAEKLEYTIVLTAGKGGSISPSGAVTVAEGESIAVTVQPDEGYELSEVRINGESIGALTQFTIDNVASDHSVYAVFALAKEESVPPTETERPDSPGLPASPSDIR